MYNKHGSVTMIQYLSSQLFINAKNNLINNLNCGHGNLLYKNDFTITPKLYILTFQKQIIYNESK